MAEIELPDPAKLRDIADWLDTLDVLLGAYLQHGDFPDREVALKHLADRAMQTDLHRWASNLEMRAVAESFRGA